MRAVAGILRVRRCQRCWLHGRCSAPWGMRTTIAARNSSACLTGWSDSFGQCPPWLTLCAMPWILQGWGWMGIVPESTFSPFFPKWCISIPHLGHWFSPEERMGREVIRFTVCLDSYICLNVFLQLPILYLCNYFPNSIDNAMALLLVTSLLLLYFSPSAHSLKAGTNRYYHRKLHSIWGIFLSQNKHDSFLISHCS